MNKKIDTFFYYMLFSTVTFLFIPQNIHAASSGKISGKVIDKKTNEPLIGVNVIIENTSMGAATDINGEYFILNIPPGIYSVQASTIGYRKEKKTEVNVYPDRTTNVDFSLELTSLNLGELVVTAKREIVHMDVSATQTVLSVTDVEAQPTTTFMEVLTLLPGLNISNTGRNGTGITIRGGGIDETDFRIDGISFRDPLTQSSFLQVPITAMNEIQILTGGFSAEYGGVRSGIINVGLREGSFNKYNINARVKYSPATLKHFGPNAFDKNGRIWQVFAGPKAFVGTTEEDVAEFNRTNGASGYPFEFKGWNAIAEEYLNDDNPSNDITPQHALELWKWQHRPIEYANRPDYSTDFSIDGPILKDELSFLFSYKREDIQYPYPLSTKDEVNNLGLLKLTYKASKELKINLTGMYGNDYGSAIGGTGDVGKIAGEFWGPVAGLASGSRAASEAVADAFGYNTMFNEGYYSTRKNHLVRFNLEATYVFNPSTYALFKYHFGRNWVKEEHIGQRDSSGVYRIGDKVYDETPRGWASALPTGDQTNTFYTQGGGQRFDESSNYYNSVQIDLTSQVDQHNQIKGGFGITLNTIKSRSAVFWLPTYRTYEEAPWTWQRWNEYPTQGFMYLQDKLEFEGMIANVGLRAEYLDPNTNAYRFDTPYDYYYTTSKFSVGTVKDIWFESQKTEPAKAKIKLEPRIGISFPVSTSGKLYFNYGHFYQPPDFYRLYSRAVTGGGAPGFIASFPNLDWPRTIQYEVGFEQSIIDLFLVRIAGYYKDITGQFKLIQGINWDENVNNHIWTNNEYADIRGFELGFNKPVGNFITFNSNFDYSVSSTGTTSLNIIYENPTKAKEEKSIAVKQKPIPLININAALSLHTPDSWSSFGLNNITATFLYTFEDGGEFIFNPEAPTENQHYIQVVDYSNIDFKLKKRMNLGENNLVIYLDILNLFNQKYLYTGSFTFAELQRYKNSLHLSWEKGEQHGNDKWGDYPSNGNKEYIDIGWRNWMQFLNPRKIAFGVELSL
jgi:outer membrane receptor protein involved in Fe transport